MFDVFILPSGDPILPSGMVWHTLSLILSGTTSVIGVTVKPGNTAFTRIPCLKQVTTYGKQSSVDPLI